MVFTVYLLVQTFFFPESPRFNYSKENFPESKDGLSKVASFNNNEKFTPKFKYDTEKEIIDIKSEGGDAKTEHKLDGGNIYGITTPQYVKNLILLLVQVLDLDMI